MDYFLLIYLSRNMYRTVVRVEELPPEYSTYKKWAQKYETPANFCHGLLYYGTCRGFTSNIAEPKGL